MAIACVCICICAPVHLVMLQSADNNKQWPHITGPLIIIGPLFLSSQRWFANERIVDKKKSLDKNHFPTYMSSITFPDHGCKHLSVVDKK
jgi:hypothetical protein